MNRLQTLFLEALKASLLDQSVEWTEEIPEEEWKALFFMAEQHSILPMIYEAVYQCPAAKRTGMRVIREYKRQMVQSVMMQTMKTIEFLRLYKFLKDRGFAPCVVKGIVLRELYPKPDYRESADEDLVVFPDEFPKCHQAMLNYGMIPFSPEKDPASRSELAYGKKGSPVYIELHKYLFPAESEVYGDLNRYFANSLEQSADLSIQGEQIRTLNETDHMFYLICHAFKHFLHSGFGVRQVCDMILFASRYGENIDWNKIVKNCSEIHADVFAQAVFKIGENYLTLDKEKAKLPKVWKTSRVDEKPMLKDLLDGGTFGDSSMSRKHSSSITLNAVAAGKQGKKTKSSLFKTLFPSAKQLEGRYPRLKKAPWLLPYYWIRRILEYYKETKHADKNNPAESLKIGSQRTELMKFYGILK